MQDTAGKPVRTHVSSFYGPLYTDVQMLTDHQELQQLCTDKGFSLEDQ